MWQLVKHVAKQALGLGGERKMLEVGSPAPVFSVEDHHGNVRTLADFAGRSLVLWFYPKADTPG